MNLRLIFSILVVIGLQSCNSTEIALHPIADASFETMGIASAQISDKLKNQPLKLYAQTDSEKIEIPYQIIGNKLYWKILKNNSTYLISNESPSLGQDISMSVTTEQIEVFLNNKKVTGYQMALKEVPKEVSKAYQRSGYLHPVNTPSGKRLTRIQPKDHYHHYGIWNPWTHTLFDGDTIDFWNLNKKQGTVRFSKLLNKVTGPVFSEFEVLHEHVVLKDEKNTIALNEIQNIRIFPMDEKRYLMDLKISYQCATDKAFKIIKYRYGGLGWRTTEVWNNQNSRILTSEGKTRKNADGSTARWCIVDGQLENAYGGVLLLSHPQNYNHPEPLRIWPEDQYERGDLFVNFATTKTKDWILNPGETYELNYRLIVYDGKMDTESAEKAWNQFVNPLQYELKP